MRSLNATQALPPPHFCILFAGNTGKNILGWKTLRFLILQFLTVSPSEFKWNTNIYTGDFGRRIISGCCRNSYCAILICDERGDSYRTLCLYWWWMVRRKAQDNYEAETPLRSIIITQGLTGIWRTKWKALFAYCRRMYSVRTWLTDLLQCTSMMRMCCYLWWLIKSSKMMLMINMEFENRTYKWAVQS